MPNTLNNTGVDPATAYMWEPAATSAQSLAFTGATAPPVTNMTIVQRFATPGVPSGAGTVADLWMVGGQNNPRQWQLVTYTCTAGALSAAAVLNICDAVGASGASSNSSGEILASVQQGLSGGIQGSYGGTYPWIRFSNTLGTPANGNTVADLVMPGGRNNSAAWYVVVYTVTGGVLS